jgi:hypothetical protein
MRPVYSYSGLFLFLITPTSEIRKKKKFKPMVIDF